MSDLTSASDATALEPVASQAPPPEAAAASTTIFLIDICGGYIPLGRGRVINGIETLPYRSHDGEVPLLLPSLDLQIDGVQQSWNSKHGWTKVFGGAVDDVFIGGFGPVRFFGRDGDDHLLGSVGDDVLYGQDGDDVLGGMKGDDLLVGGKGSDIYVVNDLDTRIRERAGEGVDTVRVFERFQSATDEGGTGVFKVPMHVERVEVLEIDGLTVNGSAGDDSIFGFAFLDAFCADRAAAESRQVGADVFRGGAGDDRLFGHVGDDVLKGQAGFDRIYGGAGDDILIGGADRDRLFGEAGADRFVVKPDAGIDTVRDFKPGEDVLDVRSFGFASFDALMANAGVTDGGALKIALSDADLVFLVGVAIEDLNPGDVLV